MSYDNLDNLFRKKLKQREFTPSDAAWGSMEQMLDGGGGKGGAWRWKALVFALLAGVGIWCAESYVKTEGAYAPRSQNELFTQEVLTTLSKGTSAVSVNADSEALGSEKELTGTEILSATRESFSNQNEVSESIVESIEEEPGNKAFNASNSDPLLSEDKMLLESTAAKSSQAKGEGLSQAKSQFDEVESGTSDQKDPLSLTALQSEVNNPEQHIDARASVDDRSPRGSEPSMDGLSISGATAKQSDNSPGDTEDLGTGDLDSLRMLGPTVSLERIEQTLETSVDSLSPMHRYVQNEGRWEFAIEPYVSFDRVSKTLSSSNGEWDSALSYRERNESSIWSTSYGVDIRAERNGLGFGTGLSFIEYGEDVAYKSIRTDSTIYEDYVELVFLDTTFITYIYDSAMVVIIDSIVTTEVYDSMFVTFTDSTIITSIDDRSAANGITSLTYIEVPLMISYGFEHKRWSFEPSVGISFGFLRGYRGTYYGVSDELVEIGTQELVLKKTIVQAHYGLGIGYDLADGFGLWVAARSKRGLNSVMEDSDYNQRYRSNSLRVGIRYTF